MAEQDGRRPGGFEYFPTEDGVEVPLQDAALDDDWVNEFNEWLKEELSNDHGYRLQLLVGDWYALAIPTARSNGGGNDDPMFVLRRPPEQNAEYFIVGNLVLAGFVVEQTEPDHAVPAVFLLDPKLDRYEGGRQSFAVGGLVAVPIEESPTSLKLTRTFYS